MKLNIRKTCLIGLGFMTIMMLWQIYNWFIPLYLKDALDSLFKGNEIVIGIVMGLDNLVALFMIPLMSKLSDKCTSKMGKRMPFVLIGMLLSAVTFVTLPIVNNAGKIWILLINIILVLISMNIYRSPCVSLMPDITPRKLRNQGNSVINVFGGIGMATGYLLIILFYNKEAPLTSFANYLPFICVSSIMIIVGIILFFRLKEKKFVDEYHFELIKYGIDIEEDKKDEEVVGGKAKTNKKNVFLALLVVFFVYMANNAVETWLSLYTRDYFPATITLLGITLSPDSVPMACFGIGTFALAIPAAIIADKIGRKKAILIGTSAMLFSYASMSIISFITPFSLLMLPVFLIGGAGFALVSINIYPLIVENCSSDQIGVFTGKYYTSNMLAQTITPAFCGLFISDLLFNLKALFPYCTIFIVLALITLIFVKED